MLGTGLPGTAQGAAGPPAPRWTHILLWLQGHRAPLPLATPQPQTPRALGAVHPSLGRLARRKELADAPPLPGSLPGFYLAIPSKSLSKQYGFLTFFGGKVNSQHISDSRALLLFVGGCRGSALPRRGPAAGRPSAPLGKKTQRRE